MKFVQENEAEQNVELGENVSVTLAAVRSGIRDIDGECGDDLRGAPRRVYVEETQPGLPPSIDPFVVFIPEVQS